MRGDAQKLLKERGKLVLGGKEASEGVLAVTSHCAHLELRAAREFWDPVWKHAQTHPSERGGWSLPPPLTQGALSWSPPLVQGGIECPGAPSVPRIHRVEPACWKKPTGKEVVAAGFCDRVHVS